jgi:hypothetical protein
MNKAILNIILILVFLFAGLNIYAGNNKHFYNDPSDGSKSSNTLTDDYKLYQNYPNPFNPTTNISYKINKEGFVSLKVYNLVGQVIKVLVSEYQKQGTYEVEFDAGNLSTGVYLYKLQINDFTSVKRMTLLR